MHFLGKAAPFAAAIVYGCAAAAQAGSIPIHHARALSEAAAVKIYEHEVALFDRDPQKFDQVHKLGGELLSSESVYEKLLHEWQAHRARFEQDHQCVWRVLEGDMYYHELHPSAPPNLSIGGDPITLGVPGPPGGGPSDPGGPPPGGGFQTASVPEPSALLLLGLSLALVVLAVAFGRRTSTGAATGR